MPRPLALKDPVLATGAALQVRGSNNKSIQSLTLVDMKLVLSILSTQNVHVISAYVNVRPGYSFNKS